jgi:PPM family protein phosphatase
MFYAWRSDTPLGRGTAQAADTLMNRFSYAGISDPGRSRPRNEDRWLAEPTLGLYVVADGVARGSGGALAAQLIVETLPPLLRRHLRGVRDLADPRAAERIQDALAEVNAHVHREGWKRPQHTGMGATLVLALVWEGRALVAHVGDSRAYLYRQGALLPLTKDHSVIQRLLDEGAITPEEAADHPAGGRLTRYIGLAEDVKADSRLVELEAHDRLLLCSDGLPSMLSHAEIEGLVGLPLPPLEICRLLVGTANLQGGLDNVTAVVVCPEEVLGEKREATAQRRSN